MPRVSANGRRGGGGSLCRVPCLTSARWGRHAPRLAAVSPSRRGRATLAGGGGAGGYGAAGRRPAGRPAATSPPAAANGTAATQREGAPPPPRAARRARRRRGIPGGRRRRWRHAVAAAATDTCGGVGGAVVRSVTRVRPLVALLRRLSMVTCPAFFRPLRRPALEGHGHQHLVCVGAPASSTPTPFGRARRLEPPQPASPPLQLAQHGTQPAHPQVSSARSSPTPPPARRGDRCRSVGGRPGGGAPPPRTPATVAAAAHPHRPPPWPPRRDAQRDARGRKRVACHRL